MGSFDPYRNDDPVGVDNSQVEKAIHPTSVSEKKRLFIDHLGVSFLAEQFCLNQIAYISTLHYKTPRASDTKRHESLKVEFFQKMPLVPSQRHCKVCSNWDG